MKKILGLDLGSNSIGWAVINADEVDNVYYPTSIDNSGSRIIPMDAATLGDFDKGNTVSQTKERTGFRGVRRLVERNLLRRERLHRVLDEMNFLPEHYSNNLTSYGKIKIGEEPKLAWKEMAPQQFEFLFKEAFSEMLDDFRVHQPTLLHKKANGQQAKIPCDWTIYYLRKKALSQKITKEELAWILLNFNQKRGYYQLRGEEDEENLNKLVEFHTLKVVAVEDSGEKKGVDSWYNIHLENGWIYRRTSSVKLDWVGKIKEFIVTTDVENDGTPKLDKDGNIKRSFRAPKEDDWTLLKKKTEYDIEQTGKTVGAYIYDNILANPNQKIRGKLVRTIERKFYKTELKQILEKQKLFHVELQSRELYENCINELYRSNELYRQSISNRDFTYLFVDDIIFYQRPLKSKKSLISNCSYEQRYDKEGNIYPIKCIAKSNPIFQEFRLWQFVSNIRIYEREQESDGKLRTDVDVTAKFIQTEDDLVALFEWLNNRKEITQDVLLGTYFKIKKIGTKDRNYPYRWNYVEDKKYPCNETRALILSKLDKSGISSTSFTENEQAHLWHILYSVEDKYEIEKALTTFATANNLSGKFIEEFSKFPPFKKEYGSYSEKAIKKLLPLMRMGKCWSQDNIDSKTKCRIEKLINGEYDEAIRHRVREKALNLTDITHFNGLPLWMACYVVYDRHSEAKEITKWHNPSDIDDYLKNFKQHSLRNPIVEQVITETLRTVRDIWLEVGNIDEIHVELGREMKNPADKRAKMTQQINDNENTNLRIKAMLAEFVNAEYNIESVRPYSPSQQDILRIYEDYAVANLSAQDNEFDFISKISKIPQPTKSEIHRYKLWLEQKYRSPYTGDIIPLGKLFTHAYEIEHVIPQSRYFDDSFSNKIICESEVNKLKDSALGYEFISNNSGKIVELSHGKTTKVFTILEYEKFVKENYCRNRSKMKKLLMADIPDDFIARQLNDSRYISKVVKGLLSNIVRVEGEQEAISKNVITCTGGITDRLKKEWGIGNVWNHIVLPRFQRLNELTNNDHFTAMNQQGHIIPNMPLELQKGFNKKRIDHRHHAMDAIVIACATRQHVNLLNNEAAKSTNAINRYQLSRKLRRYEKVEVERNGERKVMEVAKEFIMPWDTFASDVQTALSNIVISFKQNLRVINKTVNYNQRYQDGEKVAVKQQKGDSWAIRKPMHKDTVYGEVNLRKIKTVNFNKALENSKAIVEKDFKVKILQMQAQGVDAKGIKNYFNDNKEIWSDVNLAQIQVYYFTKDTSDRYFATRKLLDSSFDIKKIVDSVTDTGIQKILLGHLAANSNNPELAFSADGIDQMNRNILQLNDGKFHQPIYKVRYYERAEKFAVGQSGNKSSKFVEAADDTNIFFAVYKSNTDVIGAKRTFATIPLRIVIDRQKQGLASAPNDENGNPPLFVLSPNDLVYVPTSEQIGRTLNVTELDKNRIYKMVSANKRQCFFIPHRTASSIVKNAEFTTSNKMEKTITGEMIKEVCLPIKTDRLGNIIKVGL